MSNSDALSAEALKAELLATDPEFHRLAEEHRACEARLAELNHKSLLAEEDEIEEKQLKRHKLTLKDRMAAMMRAHEGARLAV